ncbi:hypothetical protein GBO14_07205 [Pseudoalteromonas shioyasakiensis]|uniref:hypothetical protein n=1 Tax=Pseudoalteromonas shioyasakiensis TaxID=1190813 RepID=UPI0020944923|nr:hypothetical protein [Pseudoalteromonas shioyasakiensis]MCO6354524.1 hypothetical protein [Pseudoalteromonas shioyasakiensis]
MKFLIIAPFVLLAGCATTDASNDEVALAKAENDSNYVCQTVKKTGSHFNKRRCITKEAQKREEESAKKAMEELDRNWNLNGG